MWRRSRGASPARPSGEHGHVPSTTSGGCPGRSRVPPGTTGVTRWPSQCDVPRNDVEQARCTRVTTRGVLDPVEERRAVAAEQHQRHQPPGRRSTATTPPPAGQRATASRLDGSAGADHVGTTASAVAVALTPPHSDARRARTSRGPTGAEPPRRASTSGRRIQGASSSGHASDGDGPEGAEHPGHRAKASAATAGDGPAAADVRTSEPEHAEEARQRAARPPQPLDHPGGATEQPASSEERTHRQQVAVGLVLELAEGRRRVPQVQRARHQAARVDGQVELGVRRTTLPGGPGDRDGR